MPDNSLEPEMAAGRRPRAVSKVRIGKAILGQPLVTAQEGTAADSQIHSDRTRPIGDLFRSAFCPCDLRLVYYAGWASMMLGGNSVGVTRNKVNPADCSSWRNSDLVRSLPPAITSMLRSMNLAK